MSIEAIHGGYKYSYWRDDKKPIPEEQKEILKEEANERIYNAMREGFTSGDLFTEIDGEHINGYWETL